MILIFLGQISRQRSVTTSRQLSAGPGSGNRRWCATPCSKSPQEQWPTSKKLNVASGVPRLPGLPPPRRHKLAPSINRRLLEDLLGNHDLLVVLGVHHERPRLPPTLGTDMLGEVMHAHCLIYPLLRRLFLTIRRAG